MPAVVACLSPLERVWSPELGLPHPPSSVMVMEFRSDKLAVGLGSFQLRQPACNGERAKGGRPGNIHPPPNEPSKGQQESPPFSPPARMNFVLTRRSPFFVSRALQAAACVPNLISAKRTILRSSDHLMGLMFPFSPGLFCACVVICLLLLPCWKEGSQDRIHSFFNKRMLLKGP